MQAIDGKGERVMPDVTTNNLGRTSRFPALRRWELSGSQTAWLGLVLLVVAVAYLRSLRDGFVYDDFPYIVFNPYLHNWSFAWLSWTHDVWWFRDPDNLPQSPYYRPVQNTFLFLVFPIAGKSALAWHLVKMALHLAVVLLVFRVAQLITKNFPTALLAALFFGVLAAHAEPVVWVSAFHEPVSAIFELGAFCAFLSRPPKKPFALFVPIVLFALAAFAHESAVLFPIMIAAYVFLLDPAVNAAAETTDPRQEMDWMQNRWIRTVLLTAPFVAVDFLYVGVRLYVLGRTAFMGMVRTNGMLDLVGKQVVIRQTVVNPPANQILNTLPQVVLEYLQLLVMPWLAGPAHPVGFIKLRTFEDFYFPLGVLVLLVAIGFFALRRTNHARFYLFCVVWWFVSLAPALSLNQVVSLVQDRYEYVASIGFCLLIADLCIVLANRGMTWRNAIVVAAGLFTAAQVFGLWLAEPIWHDNETMFSTAVKISPNSLHFRERYAETLEAKGDLPGAAEQLVAAARVEPNEYIIHYQLGQLYLQMGRKEEAQAEFRAYLRSFAPWTIGGGIRHHLGSPNPSAETHSTPPSD
jgi:protein O-mannosyl-transferase